MREAEAAQFLGVTVRTLRNYRRKGTLAYREVKGKTRPNIEYEQTELEGLKEALDAKRAHAKKPTETKQIPAQRVTFGLSPEAYEEFAKEAERYGYSSSEYARRLVRDGLESRFHTETEVLREEIKRLSQQIARMERDYAAAFEVVLEFGGLDPAEAKRWVRENLR